MSGDAVGVGCHPLGEKRMPDRGQAAHRGTRGALKAGKNGIA
jgi:hypothetical protein